MYARVIQVLLKPGHMEQAITYFSDSVGPALQQIDGFRNSRFLTNPTTHQALMVTLWASAGQRESAQANGLLQRVLQEMGTYFAQPPTIDTYEVSVQVV